MYLPRLLFAICFMGLFGTTTELLFREHDQDVSGLTGVFLRCGHRGAPDPSGEFALLRHITAS